MIVFEVSGRLGQDGKKPKIALLRAHDAKTEQHRGRPRRNHTIHVFVDFQ